MSETIRAQNIKLTELISALFRTPAAGMYFNTIEMIQSGFKIQIAGGGSLKFASISQASGGERVCAVKIRYNPISDCGGGWTAIEYN